MNLDKFNKPQKEAVKLLEGPLLILAGAGSGKTSTMTGRIAYMIEQGISRYNILAVTFTNKAAGEMRERVEALVGSCDGMWILTFHAMCLRILKMDANLIGYGKNFVIYDTTDQKTLIKNILKDFNINDKEFGIPYLLSIISNCKEQGQSPELYRKNNEENFRTKTIYNVYKEYTSRLKKNNAMDFDDLLLNTLILLRENPELLDKYRRRFQYIMVDEYQDTNHIQYMLIKLLADEHHNLCVVGDDDQCIYEWRGADIRNILDFEKDFPEAKVIKLEQNYRSYGNILAGAHSVIENNRGRKNKKLWTDKEAGHKIRYYRADTEKDEARYIVSEIGFMKTGPENYLWSDFAILYRTNAQSRVFEQAFAERGIPYRILSGLRYYDRKEIKDLMAYMRLVANPKDDLALSRIINEPKRGMGAKSMEKISSFATMYGESLLETLSRPEIIAGLSGKSGSSVKALIDCLNLCSSEADNLRVSDIYDELLVKTGYIKALEDAGTVEAEGRIENLMEFKSVIADYEKEAENPTLAEFMEKITLMAEVDNHDENTNAVVLMTMHSSKGLEFSVVFLPGLEDGLFPGHRALENDDSMEEERRLCYVGMTRAKERLILTSASMRTIYGRSDYTRESTFLRELNPKLMEGDGVFRKKKKDDMDVYTGGRDGYSNPNPIKPFDVSKYSSACKTGAFDLVKNAKMATRANVSSEGAVDIKEGDRVSHSKFGEGLVIETDERTLTVMFDSVGRKKLAKGIAHIKKL